MSAPILYLGDNASQFRPAAAMARAIAADRGLPYEGHHIRGPRTVSEAQLSEAGISEANTWQSLRLFFDGIDLEKTHVLVAFLTGSRLLELNVGLRELAAERGLKRRPVVVTGYNGVVYEKHIEGLLWRIGCDVVMVNSPRDRELFGDALSALGVDSDCICVGGLAVAQFQERQPRRRAVEPVQTLVFATQGVVPGRLLERWYVFESLCRYAREHPERRVIIKSRSRPGEQTFHVEKHPYESLDAALSSPSPPNLTFAYGDMDEVLEQCDLLVTVSSTAVFDALVRGIPAGILTDVGIRESLGNHYFLGSGLLTTVEELIADRMPEANAEWLGQNGLASEHSMQAIADKVSALLAEQAASGTALPFPLVYYDRAKLPFFDPGWRRPKIRRPLTARRVVEKLITQPSRFFRDLKR